MGKVNVVVCTQPRTGSEWFGRLLAERGFMKMREGFNSLLVNKNIRGPGTLNEKFYVWGQKNKGTDFVAKLMSDQIFFDRLSDSTFGEFKNGGNRGPWEHIVSLLPHERTAYIHLLRKDSFSCARSQKGALAVNDWERSTQDVLSKDDISKRDVAWVNLNNAVWDYVLFEPYVIYYEDLKKNTATEMQGVIDYIEWVRDR